MTRQAARATGSPRAGEGPSLNFVEAMEQEHTRRPDSRARFTTPNYGITTCPAQATAPPRPHTHPTPDPPGQKRATMGETGRQDRPTL